MMTHSPYDIEASAESDAGELPPLPFEAEFDGIRRAVTPKKQPLFDPQRYWDLHGGTD